MWESACELWRECSEHGSSRRQWSAAHARPRTHWAGASWTGRACHCSSASRRCAASSASTSPSSAASRWSGPSSAAPSWDIAEEEEAEEYKGRHTPFLRSRYHRTLERRLSRTTSHRSSVLLGLRTGTPPERGQPRLSREAEDQWCRQGQATHQTSSQRYLLVVPTLQRSKADPVRRALTSPSVNPEKTTPTST